MGRAYGVGLDMAPRCAWQRYTPLAYLDGEGSQRSLRVDYSARELSVREGQRVQALTTESGWAWCRADDGQKGWVPLSSLEMNG